MSSDFSSAVPPVAPVARVEPVVLRVPTPQGSIVFVLWIKIADVAQRAIHKTSEFFGPFIPRAVIPNNIRPMAPPPSASLPTGGVGRGGNTHLIPNHGPNSPPPSPSHFQIPNPNNHSSKPPGNGGGGSDRPPERTLPPSESVAPPSDLQKEPVDPARQDNAARPMPPPIAKEYVPENLEKLLISFVALTVATMKPGTHKGLPTPPQKEIKEPEIIQPKPHADIMRLEPKAQTEQQHNSSSNNGQQQQGSKLPQPQDVKTVVTPMPAPEAKGEHPAAPLPIPQPQQAAGVQKLAAAQTMPQQPAQPVVDKPAPQPPQQIPLGEVNQLAPNADPAPPAPQSAAPQPAPVDGNRMTTTPTAGPFLPAGEPGKTNPVVRPLDTARVVEVQASHVKPRVDAVTPKERQEAATNPVAPNRDDQKIEFRLPIMPDLPLSREGVLKKMARSNGSHRLEHEGHRLGDLILMMACAVLCGARSVSDIFRFLDARKPFFTAWLGLKQGMPTVRTLEWLLHRLHPDRFQELLDQALAGRNSFVYQVQVWDSDRGVIFGELQALQKNPRPIILEEVLAHLDLEYAAVTVDSRELNPAVARQIGRQGAEYIMAIRGAHGAAYESIQEYFQRKPVDVETFHEAIKDQQRTEQREFTISRDLSWLDDREQWPRLQCAVSLLSELYADRRRTTEQRYYLSSLALPAGSMAANIRILSLVEQRVEWFLDCDFSRTQEALSVEHAQRNLETLIKQSWLILEQDKSVNGSFEIKRQKARQDNHYLRQLVSLIP